MNLHLQIILDLPHILIASSLPSIALIFSKIFFFRALRCVEMKCPNEYQQMDDTLTVNHAPAVDPSINQVQNENHEEDSVLPTEPISFIQLTQGNSSDVWVMQIIIWDSMIFAFLWDISSAKIMNVQNVSQCLQQPFIFYTFIRIIRWYLNVSVYNYITLVILVSEHCLHQSLTYCNQLFFFVTELFSSLYVIFYE